ncbi:MAG: hypothetical protein AABX40_00945 [Candidatus Hydrothermarchaeota archaeon]
MDLAGVKQMLEQENELHEEALKKNRELIACMEDYLGGSISVEDFTADLRRIQKQYGDERVGELLRAVGSEGTG